MYESPIHIIDNMIADCIYEMKKKQEDDIYQAILKNYVTIDKDELIKALKYDRDQYNKGYADAMAAIVRCKDCEYCKKASSSGDIWCHYWGVDPSPNDFCSQGIRKSDS